MKKLSSNIFHHFLFIIFLPGFLHAQLQITLALDKETFLVDEPVWYKVIEKNIGDSTLNTSPLTPGATSYCKIVLTDDSGKIWNYIGGSNYYPPDFTGIQIGPSDSLAIVRELLTNFGIQDEQHNFIFYLPPGDYTMQFIHHTNTNWHEDLVALGKQYGLKVHELVDKGTIRSNRIHFKVVTPENEEARVHNILLEAYGLLNEYDENHKELKYKLHNKFLDIYKNHPSSVYAIAAYHAWPAIAPRTDALERFRDSYMVKRILKYTDPATTDTSYELWKAKYPKSKLVKFLESGEKNIK